MKEKIVTGFINFDQGLFLESNCLNKKFKISIAGINWMLKTPILPKNFKQNKENINHPLIQPKSNIVFNPESIEWGIPKSWPTGDSIIKRFLIENTFKHSDLDRSEKILNEEISKWIEIFENNGSSLALR